jgi:pimeloyl-ACP methyl ester carboxylesterase
MEDIFIETDLATVHAMSAGKRGQPLVLGIHGWSQRNGWHTWEPLMAPLAEAGFWVISLDMPGWGQSVLKRPQRLNGDNSVTAVLAVLDGLQAKSAAIMGKSWGGAVALETALMYPQRVSKLILTAPARRNLDPLKELLQPTLLAWAEDDPVIPYEHAARFVNAIPDVQFVSYEAGGHSAAQKNVDDFAPKAIDFLKRG